MVAFGALGLSKQEVYGSISGHVRKSLVEFEAMRLNKWEVWALFPAESLV